MNTIYELQAQDLCDSWSLFYFALAGEVLKTNLGEDRLRAIVRGYGKKVGEAELASMRKRGLKPNIENFYLHPAHRFYDPRLLVEKQRLNEQVALFNVVRCPFAHIARLCGCDFAAKIFCEEFTQACTLAFTGDVSQANLSELLTEPRDTHCRISVYFRPANSSPEQVKECFSEWKETMHAAPSEQDLSAAPAIWSKSAQLLLEAFMELAPETVGTALKNAAVSLADFIKKRAIATKNDLSCDFASAHCAVPTIGVDGFSAAFLEALGL